MKRVIAFVCAFICLAILSSCDAPGVYSLNDSLPPLIDSETEYANTPRRSSTFRRTQWETVGTL